MARTKGDDYDTIIRTLKDQYKVEGEMTLRRCWYVLLSKGLVHEHPNPQNKSQRDQPYQQLSKMLLGARINGDLPWEVIVDRTRRLDKPLTWESVDEAVNRVLDVFLYDPIGEQERYIEVWVEKDAVSQRIYQTAEEFFVPVITARGFSSGTYLHNGAERFNEVPSDKQVTVIYLSDFDPEGEYFPQLFKEQIGKRYGCGRSVEIEKLALTRKQIDTLKLPWIPLIIKQKHLFKEYVKRYVNANEQNKVELDAMDNVTLAEILSQRLSRLLDREIIAESLERSRAAVKEWRNRYKFKEE